MRYELDIIDGMVCVTPIEGEVNLDYHILAEDAEDNPEDCCLPFSTPDGSLWVPPGRFGLEQGGLVLKFTWDGVRLTADDNPDEVLLEVPLLH